MKIYSIPLVLCFIISIPSVSSQASRYAGEGSCVGKCGQAYSREDACHCDYNCVSYMECCKDFRKVCTKDGSCKGRCSQGFVRGQTCDCDPGCDKFGKCCPDYKDNCVEPTEVAESEQGRGDRPPQPTRKPGDVPEDPNGRSTSSSSSSPGNKKRISRKPGKAPKKKKTLGGTEEEVEEDGDGGDGNPRKRKRTGYDTEDPDASPNDPDPKGKKKSKKSSSIVEGDDGTDDDGGPSGKKKKKSKYTDEDEDDDGGPSKPGKGKNPKKKPNPKDIPKKKKKKSSEEERQETVESEFSSSSQSSSSHTRSKSSTRRLSGKKNTKDKKKFPEIPEDPLMAPKRKKDRETLPTPEPTFGDEGSGDDGSGMDLSTTAPTTLMANSTATSQTTMEITSGTVNPSKSPTENPSTPNTLSTKEGLEKTSTVMIASTQSPTAEDKTTGKSTSTDTLLQTTTQESEQAQTKATINPSDTPVSESSTRHSDHTISSKTTTQEPSAETQQTLTTEQSAETTTEEPEEEPDVSTKKPNRKPRPKPTKRVIVRPKTEDTELDDTDTSTESIRPTKAPKNRGFLTSRPMRPEEREDAKTPKPSSTNPYRICDLLKEESINLRISDEDLRYITDICTEMQQHYPPVSTPSPDIMQPDTDDRNIPTSYPDRMIPNSNQQPDTRLIQIMEEIYRKMNNPPMKNITIIHGYNINDPSIWLLLLNKIKSANDPQKNLCNGQPVDGMTTLQNGSMVAFRGPYFWMLNQGGVMESPRKISEVWGIPSPIDTVFTRCNCGGKTFFFKGPNYWRFTNDAMDEGYPKQIIKGFGGLRGTVSAVLPVAGFRTRPESVYFFKPGGAVQKYTFRQEQAKRCTKKKRPSTQYPIYSQNIQTVRYRFPRAIVRHRIQIHRTYASVPQPLGVLHEPSTVRLTWRGVPDNIVSAISLPNYQKPDGFDYYAFSKDKYYNINMSSKVAVKPPPGSEQKTTKDWYKCKE